MFLIDPCHEKTGILAMSCIDWPVQQQKKARNLKFHYEEQGFGLYMKRIQIC